ncbi:murein transglycosylase A [Legionella sp. CNM-4043-24]|uniref:murein transglycosylase A n=1 Tax=Legionella sp. CNM-4043-24 TaxID=3421646 RepID=UPI00403B14B3
MIQKRLFTLTGIISLALISIWSLSYQKTSHLPAPVQTGLSRHPEPIKVSVIPAIEKPAVNVVKRVEPQVVNPNKIALRNLALKEVPFTQLPGWDGADVKKSLEAFQRSCQTLLNQKPTQSTGPQQLKIKARDWQPACRKAININYITDDSARDFFETNFHALEFKQKTSVSGVFTGYYTPRLQGSLIKTKEYSTPIYGLPRIQKGEKRRHYYTRAEIDNGAIKNKAPVLAWIKSPVDRLFMEIEGAGVIQLPEGKKLYLSFAGQNGAPYTSIAGVLIRQGVMTKNTASKTAIKRYLDSNPSQANRILHQNKSFVFFEPLKKPAALGAQGMALTPGYSLAVDRKWIPLGAPLWLATKKPNQRQFQRLMIAQDTGGAIQGAVRGDVYWGSSKRAAWLGEHMKNKGRYWLLLPKPAFERLAA